MDFITFLGYVLFIEIDVLLTLGVIAALYVVKDAFTTKERDFDHYDE